MASHSLWVTPRSTSHCPLLRVYTPGNGTATATAAVTANTNTNTVTVTVTDIFAMANDHVTDHRSII